MTSSDNDIYTGLTQLGHASAIPESPDAAVLESVPNPHPGTAYLVRFAAPEFTSLCPFTGQPDFAHLVIDYIARAGPSLLERAFEAFPGVVPQSRRVP